jgi:hypothetical protein
MPKMQKLRLADSSLIFHLQEVMENAGWANGAYEVIDAYPTNLDRITIFPAISVQSNVGDSLPVQVGTKSTLSVTWLIDIFAQGDGQRDDIVYFIWDDLQENQIVLYDFNTGFPPSVGDYTGISTLGKIYFDNVSFQVIDPDEFSTTIVEKHHALIIASGSLSID